MGKPAIVVENMSMMFNLNKEKVDNLKEYFIKLVTRKLHFTEFWALRDISFTVEKGDRVGVLGFNGAGKSTLIRMANLLERRGQIHVFKAHPDGGEAHRGQGQGQRNHRPDA